LSALTAALRQQQRLKRGQSEVNVVDEAKCFANTLMGLAAAVSRTQQGKLFSRSLAVTGSVSD